MDIKLFIGDMPVDLNDEVQILFNWTETDLSNPTNYRNGYSKTITLEGTNNNNELFGHFWDLERYQLYGGNSRSTFNPSYRVPFVLYHNGSVYERGYVKLEKVIKENEINKYEISLFGGLGSFLYNLETDWNTGNKRTLADLDYFRNMISVSFTDFSFFINKETINQAWEYANTTDVFNKYYHLNFAPTYRGLPDNLDTDKVLINISGTTLTDSYSGYSTYNGYALGKLPDKLTEEEVKDYRSYLQTPVIRVKTIIDAICQPYNNRGKFDSGYTVDLDSDFFNDKNPYYSKSWMTLNNISLSPIEGTGSITDYSDIAVSDIYGNESNRTFVFDLGENHKAGKMKIAFDMDITVPNTTSSFTDNYLYLASWQVSGSRTKYINAMGIQAYSTSVYGQNDNVLSSSKISWNSNTVSAAGEREYFDYQTAKNSGYFIPKQDKEVINWEGMFRRQENHIYRWNKRIELECDQPEDARYLKINIQLANSEGNSSKKNKLANYIQLIANYTLYNWGIPYSPFVDKQFLLNEITTSNFYSDKSIPHSQVLATSFSPAEFLVSYCKMFGLYIYKDLVEDKIYIKTRSNFFKRDNVLDIDDKIDLSQKIEINPVYAESNFYSMSNESEKSKNEEEYTEKYSKVFGQKVVETGNEFNADTTELVDSTLKGAIQTKEQSLYFFKKGVNNPYVYNGFSYELYKNGSYDSETYTVEVPKNDITLTFSPFKEDELYYDSIGKIQLRDKSNKGLNSEGVLLFFNGYENVSGYGYYITDDISVMNTLNNNPCWLMTNSEYDSLGNRIAIELNSIPKFSRYYEGNKWMIYSMDYGSPRQLYIPNFSNNDDANIYHNYFENYFKDLYDINTKVINCYIHTNYLLNEDYLRNIYWFRNGLWRLNKIVDYNPESENSTLCEFVKIQDLDDLTNFNPTTDRWIKITLDRYDIGQSGGTIIGTVITSDNYGWDIDSITYDPASPLPRGLVTVTPQTYGSSGSFTLSVPSNIRDAREVTINVTSDYNGQNVSGSTAFNQPGVEYTFDVSPTSLSGGTLSYNKTFNVTNPYYYDWTIQSKPNWITVSPSSITNGQYGETGDTAVTVTASKNTTEIERTGTIVLKETTYNHTYNVSVKQAGYVFSVSPTTLNYGSASTYQDITVNNPYGYAWSVTSKPDWVTTATTSTGLRITVNKNILTARTGTVVITESDFNHTYSIEVNQESGYVFYIQPTSFSYLCDYELSETLEIVNPNELPWTITNYPAWISVSPSGGTGSASTITAAENIGFERSYSGISVNETTLNRQYLFDVEQESGYYFELLPATGFSFTSASTSQTMHISCKGYNWQIISKPAWISTNYTTGFGDTNVTVTAAKNIGFERSGSITVKNLDYNLEYTLSVVQESGYVFTISPSALTFDGGGCESQTMTINNPNGYDWEIMELGSWITASPSSGNSSATVTFTAQPNSGNVRTEYFSIIENTFSQTYDAEATQSGYTFSISPTAFTYDDIVQTKYLNITKPACMAWAISNLPSWLTANPTGGTDARVALTTAENQGFERSKSGITITDTYSGREYKFNVMQESGYEFMLLPTTGLSFTSANTSQIMTVSCRDYHWQITSKPAWLEASQITGYGYTQVYLTPSTNVGYARSGVVKVKDTDYNLEYTLNVEQASGYNFSVSPLSFAFNGGCDSATMTITNPNGLEWKFYQLANWITASPSSGNSSATVTLSVTPNSGTTTRTDSFELEEETVGNTFDCTASQSAYTFSISPTAFTFDDIVQTKYLNIDKPACVAWTITNAPDWITLGATAGTDSRVSLTTAKNIGFERSKSGVTVTDAYSNRKYTFNVMQDEGYSFVLLPTTGISFTSANTSQIMTVSCEDYHWEITSKPSWIQASQITGYGYTQVYLTPTTNVGNQRTGTITVRNTDYNLDYTLNLSQAGGYSFSVSPLSFTFDGGGESKTMTITNPNGLEWEITGLASWITASQTAGTATATVTLTAAPNSGNSRSDYFDVDELTVGNTFECSASQATYSFSIEPTNLYFDDIVQTKYVNITKPSNISWTISNLPAWLSANPTGGTASRVAITSTENQGYERSQSGITITDSTSGREYKFNARQDEGYSFILLPTTGISFTSASTSQIMTVSCRDYNWQITSKPNWLSASQMTGYGYTQVYLTPTQNTGSQRSGTVTVRNTDYSLDYTLSVEQAGGYSFSVSPTTFSFNRTGGTATMTITNPNGMDWSIEQLASWMSASPSTGNSSATVTLTCAANTTTNSRTDYFEVNDDTYGDVIDCTATQDGLLTPSITSISATVENNPAPPTPTTPTLTIINKMSYDTYGSWNKSPVTPSISGDIDKNSTNEYYWTSDNFPFTLSGWGPGTLSPNTPNTWYIQNKTHSGTITVTKNTYGAYESSGSFTVYEGDTLWMTT